MKDDPYRPSKTPALPPRRLSAAESLGLNLRVQSATLLWASIAILVGAIFVSYWPAVHAGFIWDDQAHVTKPELRSAQGLYRIWFELGATQQYYPLLHSAFWVEHKLWGDSPLGYHVVNILLHAGAAVLVLLILLKLRLPEVAAFLGAAIFALHPVQVESVAWVTELKNTLSAVFYLSAMLVYLRFDETRNKGLYGAALALFVLGLLTKTVTATLPAALLVIFWWQRGRLSWKRDVLPLVPWFVLAAVGGLLTAWVEHELIGAKGQAFDLTGTQRVLLAGRVVWFYLGKLIWPEELIFIYPRWSVDPSDWRQWLFPLGLAAVLVAAVLVRSKTRAPLAAFLFFVGSLFPVLGFFNVYPFIFSFVADHFQYLASLGMITLAGAVLAWGLSQIPLPAVRGLIVAGLLTVLGVMTFQQCQMYANVLTLYGTTIEKNPTGWMAYNNRGVVLEAMGRHDEAIADFEQGLRLGSNDAGAHYNLGTALQMRGRLDEAIAHYQKALHDPDQRWGANLNLGNILFQQGKPAEAIAHYQQAIEIKPNDPAVFTDLAIVLGRQGKIDEASAQYQRALEIDPNCEPAHYNWANDLRRLGRMDEAVAHYKQALKINPNDAQAHNNLAMVLVQQGEFDEALAHWREAIRLRPNDAVSLYWMAWTLATSPDASTRNGAEAIVLAGRANQLMGGREPAVLDALAAAYAETDQFSKAVATARQALELASARNDTALSDALKTRIKLYEDGSKYRETRR